MQTMGDESKYFICTQLTRASRKIVAYYNHVLEPIGLTAQQLIALGVLIREDNLSLGQFSRRLKMGKAGAATMVNRLESLGLVTKQVHPDDGRLNVLKITEKTQELHPNIQKAVVKLEDSIESQMGVADLEKFVELLSVFLNLEF